MALILRSMYSFYNHIFTTLKDPRSVDYYLIGDSPLPIMTILTAHFLLFTYGPTIMQSRKAFELKTVLTLYNFLQVLLNTLCACEALLMLFWRFPFNWSCQSVDYSTTEHGIAELRLSYVYFCFKIFDLFDTVFIVLKKNNRQLSFLHCYHHFGICAGSYIIAKWIPGGTASILGIINTFVHSVMYFYYFLTAFKPELKKSIWWKKHITQLQLAQFTVLVVLYLRHILSADCGYPKVYSWLIFIQSAFMLILFSDFYVKVYRRKEIK